jgi:putative transposase
MDAEARRAAKLRLIVGLRQGQPWRDAAAAAGVRIGRTTAYRLRQRAALEDEAALVDGRHGHPSKVREPVRAWLVEHCRAAPGTPSGAVQAALRERFRLTVSVSQLNRVRAALGFSNRPAGAGGKWRTGGGGGGARLAGGSGGPALGGGRRGDGRGGRPGGGLAGRAAPDDAGAPAAAAAHAAVPGRGRAAADLGPARLRR